MESCWNSSTGVSSNSVAYAIAIFECCFLLPPKTKNSNVAKPPPSLVASPCFALTACCVKQAPHIAITLPRRGNESSPPCWLLAMPTSMHSQKWQPNRSRESSQKSMNFGHSGTVYTVEKNTVSAFNYALDKRFGP